jgi:FAD/FMN-containing dehydrogenase
VVLETAPTGGTVSSIDAISRFEASLRGDLIRSSHPDYDEIRALYNAMIDKYPLLIARARDAADVIATIAFARESGLPLAIRGGGHNGAGLASVDDGIMLDLSPMKGIRVDPAAGTVRVEPGCTWEEVDHATHAFGLAVPSGTIASTGVAGLTLGGGIGHLSRRWGLTIDSLLAADVVLADGSLVNASETENADLFWALRGGGGNFGVVTSFLFRAHPVTNVIGGPTFWTLDQAPEVMRWYRDFIATAPEELNGFFAVLRIPPVPPFPEAMHGMQVCAIFWCYTGPAADADRVFAPIRAMGPPLIDAVTEMPYPMLQNMFDPLVPAGLQWYWKSHFVKELPDEAIDVHMAFAESIPTQKSTMHMYPINGAVHNVDRHDTAFSYRDMTWALVIVGIDPDPANAGTITSWARDYWEALRPYAAEGAYVNMLMDEEDDQRVRTAYRDNHETLQAVKQRYDPQNLFRINWNIRPTALAINPARPSTLPL